MKEKESDIVFSICEYLAARRYLFWRQNTAPTYDKEGGFYRAMPKHAMKGVPDIIVIKDGKFIGIEVKTREGELSAEQAVFGRLCQEHGATYVIARSIEDVQRIGL
jgi:hypothetical protein